MPNGGYPLHLITRIPGSDLALFLRGSAMQLVRLQKTSAEGTRRTVQVEEVGQFTSGQITALLFHLQYWGGGTDTNEHGRPRGTFNGQRVSPQFQSTDCVYDY
jgi:hypothetical protein